MEYIINIKKRQENPNYESEMKEYRERTKYGAMNHEELPQRFVEVKVLETTLTEDEFDALRRTAIQRV